MAISARNVQIQLNGDYVPCQLDLTLNITQNTSTEDPCKPDPANIDAGASFNTYSVDSKDWSVTFSARQFADELALNNIELSELIINGDGRLAMIINTVQGANWSHPLIFEYAGEVIITSLDLNAPATGSATYDVTLQGAGPLTFTKTPAPVAP